MNRSHISLGVRPLSVVVFASLVGHSVPAFSAVDRSKPPPPAAVRPFVIEKPTELTLKNGMKVHFLKRTRAPLVDVIAVVEAGALFDPKDQPGLAAFTAQMLTQGAGSRDTFAFDDAVRGLGADLSASASWEQATVALHVPSKSLADAMPLFADALLRPRFDEDAWQRKQGELGGELMFLRNEPRFLGGLAAARALYGESRLGWNLGGTLPSLRSTKRADLVAFHQVHFRPDTTFLVVVGDVDAKSLVALLEKNLQGFAADGPRPIMDKPQEPGDIAGTDVILVDNPGAPQSVVRVVAKAAPELLPLDPAVGVMSTLLGGSFTSRLNTNLREVHGYAYGAGFSVSVRPAHTSVVSTSVATAATIPAIAEILHELGRMKEPAAAEEIARARAYDALTFPSAFDGGRSTAYAWAGWRQQRVPDARITSYMEAAQKIDAAAVVAMAGHTMDPDKSHIVVVGDAAKLEKELARFGAVRKVPVEALLPAPN